MRRRGTGSITRTPDGRHRVQIVVDGRRRSLGVHASRAEAEALLAGAVAELYDGNAREGVTLQAWGDVVLDRRERHGIRGIDQERSRWSAHVVGSEIATLPVRSLVRSDVQRWLEVVQASRARGARAGRRQIARTTAGNALTLLRAVLEDAVRHGVARENPARDVRLPRARGATRETWTYLDLDEQERLLAVVPDHARPAVAFALFTGLRQGEQWSLELADVHVDGDAPHVVVRFGAPGKPTKSGRPRRVDLLPSAVEAVRAQLELMPRANPHRLLFPTQRGTRRQRGAPQGWEVWIERAELGRPVRWHDLRHTCASSLVAGWWGRAWTLLEVRALLGHSTIQVTERYAHLAGTVTEQAVRATREAVVESPAEAAQTILRAHAERTGRGEKKASKSGPTTRDHSGSHLRGLNSRPTVYETARVSSDPGDVGRLSARECALRALELVAAGDPRALAALVDVAGRVVDGSADGWDLLDLAAGGDG